MNFIISADTDIGTTKATNQDSLTIKTLMTPQGRMVFAAICDGMGGLEKGEIASAAVIRVFDRWVKEELPALCEKPLADAQIRAQWSDLVTELNQKIREHSDALGIKMGTTATVMLITQTRYYILNVGDSRAYELTDRLVQLTLDQTFVAREVAMGNMTPEQAETDSRRSVLLQCIGASEKVYPDMFFGDTRDAAVYMLCSDGFRHELSEDEIYSGLEPGKLLSYADMTSESRRLIDLNKERGERDNISVILVRSF